MPEFYELLYQTDRIQGGHHGNLNLETGQQKYVLKITWDSKLVSEVYL